MKIQSTKTTKNKFLNILVYGESGYGKTVFGSTAPDPLFLSAESGLLSLNRMGSFDFIEIKNFKDMIDAYNFLAVEKHSYKTIIIDSLTEIQTQCMDAILDEKQKNKDEISFNDWGKLLNRMVDMVRKFRDLPCNLIVTCLQDNLMAEGGFTEKKIPMVQGSLKGKLPAYFDEVFFLFAKEVKNEEGDTVIKRGLITQGTDSYIAKDRSGMLDRIEKPNFTDIYKKIYG